MADWHPEDIKAEVRKRGATLVALARATPDLSRATLSLALTTPRRRAECVIADFLGVHPKDIWPSRYNKDGSRKRPQPVDNYRADARFGKSA